MMLLKQRLDKIWFLLLFVYIIASYIAQDVLLPASVTSILLYVFLAFSAVCIFVSGKIQFSPFLLWECIVMVLALFAMLYSPKFSVFDGTYYAMLVNFILVFIMSQMPLSEKRLSTIFCVYVFAAALLIILLYCTGNLEDSSASGRLGEELFGNSNTLAFMLMASSIYAFWILLTKNNGFQKLFSFFCLVLIYIGMFLSGGRKFVVVPLVFAYTILLGKRDKKGKLHPILYTIIFLGLMYLVYYLAMNVPAFYESIGSRFEGAFSLVDDEYSADGSTLKRMQMIEAAFEQWKKRPIFGYGFDSFKYYNAESVTGEFYYAHNNFLELLYNQGVVGFMAYYSFYIYLIWFAWKKKTDSLHKGLVVGFFISSMFFEFFCVTYSATVTQIMIFLVYYSLIENSSSNMIDLHKKTGEKYVKY